TAAGLGQPNQAQPAAPLRIDPSGDLVIQVGGGEVRFRRPTVYQPRHFGEGSSSSEFRIHDSKLIEGRYILTADKRIRFEIPGYDKSRPLVIDPTLSYSTYLGGASFDDAYGIALDASGNAYVAGLTQSSPFPTTSGAFQTASPGGSNAFVCKFSPAGSLLYSTYLGGTNTDQALAIAVDSSGSALVTGQTFSSNFPTTAGAFKATYGGKGDGFVTKLSADGSSLLYSTYVGGSGLDEARGIAVDSGDNAYITGETFSTDFPLSSAFQTANKGNEDGFVAALSSSGSLVYSTYLGGSGFDQPNGIAIDSMGRAYVTGSTNSSDFPVANAHQSACKSCPSLNDAFVAEIGAGGSGLVYSTYLGGSGEDQGRGIAVDAQDNAYVTGVTFSADFPATSGAFQRTRLGSASAFVTKISANGSALGYSTYLGSDQYTYGQAVTVLNGNAYITGLTNANSFILMNPIQSARAGFPDAFVTELDATGSSPFFSTYLGGSSHDAARAIAVDQAGNVYIAGHTRSTNLPVANAFQATYGGGDSDTFVAKILLPNGTVSLSPTSLTFANQQVGTTSAAQTVTLSNTGTTSVTIASIAVTGTNSGDFAQTNNCPMSPSTLAASASCTINVTFTPSVGGTRTGTLTVTDNAGGSPQTASLTGTGVAPGATLSPASLTFARQNVGTTSAPQAATLSNSGSAALSISSIAITGADSGDFAQTNNCGSSLAAGAQCTINVTFTPSAGGTRTATLTVTDSASGSPQTASLSGTGVASVTLSPTSLTFTSQNVGATSAPQAVTLSNSGSAPLSISSIAITGADSGDFAQTNNCGSLLAAGAQCTINVTFRPTATGTRTGTLTVTDNASGSPQTVSLTGIGVRPAASVSPTSLLFLPQLIGTTSAPQRVTLSNTGSGPLLINSIATSGPRPTTAAAHSRRERAARSM
ncbi:MAG: hypothetical protein DMG26_07295, partial [Acidobacteria bacterium]